MNWAAIRFAVLPSSICTNETGRLGNAVPIMPVFALDFGTGG